MAFCLKWLGLQWSLESEGATQHPQHHHKKKKIRNLNDYQIKFYLIIILQIVLEHLTLKVKTQLRRKHLITSALG